VHPDRVLLVMPLPRLVRKAVAAGFTVWSVGDPAWYAREQLQEVEQLSEELVITDRDDEPRAWTATEMHGTEGEGTAEPTDEEELCPLLEKLGRDMARRIEGLAMQNVQCQSDLSRLQEIQADMISRFKAAAEMDATDEMPGDTAAAAPDTADTDTMTTAGTATTGLSGVPGYFDIEVETVMSNCRDNPDSLVFDILGQQGGTVQ
jgi:hypothetical protein